MPELLGKQFWHFLTMSSASTSSSSIPLADRLARRLLEKKRNMNENNHFPTVKGPQVCREVYTFSKHPKKIGPLSTLDKYVKNIFVKSWVITSTAIFEKIIFISKQEWYVFSSFTSPSCLPSCLPSPCPGPSSWRRSSQAPSWRRASLRRGRRPGKAQGGPRWRAGKCVKKPVIWRERTNDQPNQT